MAVSVNRTLRSRKPKFASKPDNRQPEVGQAPRRGKLKSTLPATTRRKKMPSGKGISGRQMFITGKKPTSSTQLSGGRAKPARARRSA
jgi:hypothetical protein